MVARIIIRIASNYERILRAKHLKIIHNYLIHKRILARKLKEKSVVLRTKIRANIKNKIHFGSIDEFDLILIEMIKVKDITPFHDVCKVR